MRKLEIQSEILVQTLDELLGRAEHGAMAFVRCLTPDVVDSLINTNSFELSEWKIYKVANEQQETRRCITADRAVELREAKEEAVLLLIDTDLAGAGIDGIYSAAREIIELDLFSRAIFNTKTRISRDLGSEYTQFSKRAIDIASKGARHDSKSSWSEFDFLCHVVSDYKTIGSRLTGLNLWPVCDMEVSEMTEILDVSRLFVDRLLSPITVTHQPKARVELIRLDSKSRHLKGELVKFLHEADTKPLHAALNLLLSRKSLWIGHLRIEPPTQTIQGISLTSWRSKSRRLLLWSGLTETGNANDPPVLLLARETGQRSDSSQLEVRWKVAPTELQKNSAEYRVSILTDQEEELTVVEVPHSARKSGEKARFRDDDFSALPDDVEISVRVKVEVIDRLDIQPEESEEFIIRFGDQSEVNTTATSGKKIRTFSEGLIEQDSRETVAKIASSLSEFVRSDSNRDCQVLQLPYVSGSTRYFKISRPSLIKEIENFWKDEKGAIGRWSIKVRTAGLRAGPVEFHTFDHEDTDVWLKTKNTCKKFAVHIGEIGSIGQVYDDKASTFPLVLEYIRNWISLLSVGDPILSLANTLEVQSLSGKTIGLIVLPFHPLRVAWHTAYDNLVLSCAFEESQTPKDIRNELLSLDGAMFPVFLPNPEGGIFVFADTLGFHTIGMVPDSDPEPKAAVAILSRVLAENQSDYMIPLAGDQTIKVLADEITKYLDCHWTSGGLHVHALRAGDGFTVARSLGHVIKKYQQPPLDGVDQKNIGGLDDDPFRFSVDLYPSKSHQEVAGRFILEAREKRRSGAGVIATEDEWMLESLNLPGDVIKPRLRWARKETENPNSAAHIAIGFDTFNSEVVIKQDKTALVEQPYHIFGLMSFYERRYVDDHAPEWTGQVPVWTNGVKHPSSRIHTENLVKLQDQLQQCVARFLDMPEGVPLLKTVISPNKAEGLRELHRLCDWVITIDRNAGLEYFDSPKVNRNVYDAYVIDCVPERTDLSCLRLITSTTNVEEVCDLLNNVLDEMGLSRSERNSKFLLNHLKALSGRLAIRLTGQKFAASELIALAVSHANCKSASNDSDGCWYSLTNGFFVPCDDVRDLLPPLTSDTIGSTDETRPDLIYVTQDSRRRIVLQFIEVKFRRHLLNARSPDLLDKIRSQTEGLRERWNHWYDSSIQCVSFLALRRAKLARVLRFYADKAQRQCLPDAKYQEFLVEIKKMIEKGKEYTFGHSTHDRGWIFCSEYTGLEPLEISPIDWPTRVFLFGPADLPDSNFGEHSQLIQPEDPSDEKQNHEDLLNEKLSENKTLKKENLLKKDSSSEVAIQLGVEHHLPSLKVEWRVRVDGNPHLLIAGLPGMGKTTCLVNLSKQLDESGICPVIFSYHEDIDDRLAESHPNLRFVDFDGLGFNPLQVIDRSAKLPHLDVAGAIRDIFVAIFPELGDIQADYIRRAIKESFEENGWGSNSRGQTEPEFKRFVEIIQSYPKPDQGLRRLQLRLGELMDYRFFELGSNPKGSLWESKTPTVIRIHTTQNEKLQRAFAYLVFYGMYKDMFRRGVQRRITHALVLDEAHRAARLKLIPTMAKECRKYGISLVLASQEARDFDVSVFSAIANYLVLRSTDIDAKFLVRNVAKSKEEKSLIDKIKQLDRFNALFFREGDTRPAVVSLLEHL